MRTRITAAVALLVLVTLTTAGAIVYAIESQRINERMYAQVDREIAELTNLQQDGVDPATQQPFAGVTPLLRGFLESKVPDDNEILVAWLGGEPRFVSASGTDEAYLRSQEFRDTVAPLVSRNGTVHVSVPSYGDALVTVQSVRSRQSTGALVVVTYLEKAQAELMATMRTYAIVALLSLLLVTAFAGWLSGRLLAPLRTLRETTEEIGETDLSRRLPVTGNDDITALTRTVNGMLERLDEAFAGQRRFLDDAGHELKTPLTVVRGHLELLDTGSPAEVAETRELLLEEVDRMSRLVGDLILLAKSDRPDFVTTRPADLSRLTEDLVAKARGLGDRDWRLDGLAEVKVVVDEQRITQAMLQLADNAVKHTGPGDVVAIGSSYDGGSARIWVRDTGPGVPPADRQRIFERFGRSAVPEGDEGFGLGLSIVGAIVDAHGGTVAVEEADPPGARFVITLPVVGSDGEEHPWPAS
ncbi:HAMP domain-containing sensor histidine kinase [Nocardioides koreensis]|uniref:histidine kinase n=1 Tax=Nocardioides koreensis TaxID=433651 RepID=A0ABN2ZKI2_9ACTN